MTKGQRYVIDTIAGASFAGYLHKAFKLYGKTNIILTLGRPLLIGGAFLAGFEASDELLRTVDFAIATVKDTVEKKLDAMTAKDEVTETEDTTEATEEVTED